MRKEYDILTLAGRTVLKTPDGLYSGVRSNDPDQLTPLLNSKNSLTSSWKKNSLNTSTPFPNCRCNTRQKEPSDTQAEQNCSSVDGAPQQKGASPALPLQSNIEN